MLVSILIPVFNREHLLPASVESALSQTAPDLEVVISDNASTDRTWEVCQEFARRDQRVRIFRNHSNLGPVRNWMRCAHEARGEFGKFLFSDDLISPDFLERTLPFLSDPEVGMVTTAAAISGSLEYTWRRGKQRSSDYLWDSMFNGRLPVSPGTALFRMADLRRNLTDFGEHGIGPDLHLLLATAWDYPAVAHVPEPLAFFLDHPGSLSSEKRAQLGRGYAWARLRFIFSRAISTQTYMHRAALTLTSAPRNGLNKQVQIPFRSKKTEKVRNRSAGL